MLLAEYIEQLQKVLMRHGNLDVVVLTGEPLDYEEVEFSVIDIAKQDNSYDSIHNCERFNEKYERIKALILY